MTITEVAKAEGTDTLQLFVRAARLFVKGSSNPSGDHGRWESNGTIPPYMSEYLRYWQSLNRTETHSSRARY